MMRDLLIARTGLGWFVRVVIVYAVHYAILLVLARLPMTPLVFFIVNYLPLVPLAVFIIALFLWTRSLFSMQGTGTDASDLKPKRGESMGELMAILNDEDIDDLRTRVKARLEEQIDSADAEEIDTFADLLGETKRKRR